MDKQFHSSRLRNLFLTVHVRDGSVAGGYVLKAIHPYASQTQSPRLRVIQS